MDTFLKIFSVGLTLFLLMDPVGNIPLFITILKNLDPKTQKKVILREAFIALGVIILFLFSGQVFLDLIQIKTETVLISGGIILLLIAIQMVFPSGPSGNGAKLVTEDTPLIVPLAIPLIAGPALLATVMIYAEQHPWSVTIPAILIAWGLSTLILLSSIFLKKVLGEKAILACEKLMGLLLTMLAIQMLLKGLTLYIEHLC